MLIIYLKLKLEEIEVICIDRSVLVSLGQDERKFMDLR